MSPGSLSMIPRQRGNLPSATCQHLPSPNQQCQGLCGRAQETQMKSQLGPTRHCSQLEVAPQQCPSSHYLSHEKLPDQGWHPNTSAATLQPRCGPLDFFCLLAWKGKHFEATEGIQAVYTLALKAIPENAYHDAFNAWKLHWQCSIDAEGADFESFTRIVTIGSINVFKSTQLYYFLDNPCPSVNCLNFYGLASPNFVSQLSSVVIIIMFPCLMLTFLLFLLQQLDYLQFFLCCFIVLYPTTLPVLWFLLTLVQHLLRFLPHQEWGSLAPMLIASLISILNFLFVWYQKKWML